jgi:hypothetical protein
MNPLSLTNSEWLEIMRQPQVREAWGIEEDEEDEEVAEFSARVNAAKFEFHSGSPGYVGDLYVLQGDALTDEGPMLRRDSNGSLITV